MRILDIRRQRLPSLQRGERLEIVFKRRVLVIALVVGLWHTVSAQAAMAPTKGLLIQMSPRVYARAQVAQQWSNPKQQYACLDQIWTHESHWNSKAANRKSTAYGIPQFLNETWSNYNYPVRPSDPLVQVKAGLRYITKSYSTPCKAWAFWQRHGWY